MYIGSVDVKYTSSNQCQWDYVVYYIIFEIPLQSTIILYSFNIRRTTYEVLYNPGSDTGDSVTRSVSAFGKSRPDLVHFIHPWCHRCRRSFSDDTGTEVYALKYHFMNNFIYMRSLYISLCTSLCTSLLRTTLAISNQCQGIPKLQSLYPATLLAKNKSQPCGLSFHTSIRYRELYPRNSQKKYAIDSGDSRPGPGTCLGHSPIFEHN